jgi:hypothetical protein
LQVDDLRHRRARHQQDFDARAVLDVPAAELPDVMQRFRNALKPNGILYASFKHGSGEREHQARRFTDLDEPGLRALLQKVPDLAEVKTWITGDLRPDREAECWLNTLLRRTRRSLGPAGAEDAY